MDCYTARQMIEMLPPAEHDLPSTDEQALREHLASCPLCLSTATEAEEWDLTLRSVMTSVPTPEGFRDRLLAQLAQSTSHTTKAAAAPIRPRSIRRVASWLALSLALVAGFTYWFGRASQLQLATLENGAIKELRNHPDSGLPAFDRSFFVEIADSKWQKFCKAAPVGVNLDRRSGHDLAAYRVNIPSLRFRGWLVLVPISRVVDVPASTYPDTSHYAQTATWHDSHYVYLCLAEQGSLETLVAQWNSSAA